MKDPVIQAKKAINNLIDAMNSECNIYIHLSEKENAYCQQARIHGIQLSIDMIRRNVLDEWDFIANTQDYKKYDLTAETV